MPHPKVNIVVPSFNRAYYLHGALVSLTQQITDGQFDYDVTVVDNASTDNTKEIVERFSRTSPVPVRYLLETKPGDAPPRNKGIRETDGEWLAFFDDDEFADPRWLQQLLRTAVNNDAQVVGGSVHLDLDRNVIQQLSPACRNALREARPYAKDQPYGAGVAPGTCNVLISRQVFDAIGMFSEDMTGGGSDWKLIEDARAAGIVPWHAPAAVVRHRVPADRLHPRYFHWDARNGGLSQADTDFRNLDTSAVLLRCLGRLTKAAMHLPARIHAAWHPPTHGSAQSTMIWWRTEGYVRRALTVLAPTLFPQKRFHELSNFRTGRTVGA